MIATTSLETEQEHLFTRDDTQCFAFWLQPKLNRDYPHETLELCVV